MISTRFDGDLLIIQNAGKVSVIPSHLEHTIIYATNLCRVVHSFLDARGVDVVIQMAAGAVDPILKLEVYGASLLEIHSVSLKLVATWNVDEIKAEHCVFDTLHQLEGNLSVRNSRIRKELIVCSQKTSWIATSGSSITKASININDGKVTYRGKDHVHFCACTDSAPVDIVDKGGGEFDVETDNGHVSLDTIVGGIYKVHTKTGHLTGIGAASVAFQTESGNNFYLEEDEDVEEEEND